MPKVIAITTLCRNAELLPHFARHYADLAVDEVHIVLRGNKQLYERALNLLNLLPREERKRVTIARFGEDDDPCIYWTVDHEARHLRHVARAEDWILGADLEIGRAHV